MLIDTHIHLDAPEFDADREAVVARARAAGVGAFVVPAVERDNFDAVRTLATTTPGVFPALGIHPLYVDRASDDDLAALDEALGQGGCVAVGEIGLDFYVAGSDAARQREFYLAQLEIARRHGLPVILHSRRAVDEVLAGLRRVGVAGGIAHAFNGSSQQARAFIDLGFKLGFGGAMTFSGSTRIRRLAAELPLEAIVLETDAPDIAPAWGQGRRNEPENLARYAETLAELRGMTVSDVIAATGANARNALKLPENRAVGTDS